MSAARSSLIERVVTPRVFDDERTTALAFADYAVAANLLLVVTPLLVVAAIAAPDTRALFSLVAAGCGVLAVALALGSRTEWIVSVSAGFLVGCWALFAFASWTTGGVRSPSASGLFLLVAFAAALGGWRWGVPTAILSAGTVLSLTWAETSGGLPSSPIELSAWSSAMGMAAFVLSFGMLQAIVSRGSRLTRKKATVELSERRAAEQRLRDIVDNAPFGAFVCALQPDGKLIVVSVNRAASSHFGTDARSFIGQEIERAFSARSEKRLIDRFRHVAHAGGMFHSDNATFSSGGTSAALAVDAFQTRPGEMAFFFTDVTEKRRAEAKISHMAFHDELTKLPNRKLLHDRLAVALASARRRGSHVALLFIDLDEFKPINDRFGHAVGDQLLLAVAERLCANARDSDTVARIGGDEFTVLLSDIGSAEQAEAVGRKFVDAFAEPFELAERTLNVTASIGVTTTDGKDADSTQLLAQADAAMYRIKESGRNGYGVF